MKSRPVLVGLAIAAAVNTAVGFGLPWSPEQVTLVNDFVIAITAFWVQSKVTPL